jgi:hypothetical protein
MLMPAALLEWEQRLSSTLMRVVSLGWVQRLSSTLMPGVVLGWELRLWLMQRLLPRLALSLKLTRESSSRQQSWSSRNR